MTRNARYDESPAMVDAPGVPARAPRHIAALSVALGLLFLGAALIKALNAEEFRNGLAVVLDLSSTQFHALAGVILAAEAAVGAALVLAPGARWSAISGLGLLAAFSAWLLVAEQADPGGSCACLPRTVFGELSQSRSGAIVRNVFLSLACLGVVISPRRAGTDGRRFNQEGDS